MPHEKVSMAQKRESLKNFINGILTNDFGEEFVVYEYPKTAFLHLGSRMDRRDIQENSNGKIRQLDVFWDGPASPGTFPEVNISGIFRSGNIQKGSVDAYRILMHYEVEYNTDGEIINRRNFEDVLSGYSPDGLLPRLRSKDTLKYDGKTILLSVPTNVTIPPSPRPMQSGGEEYSHYGEIRVFLTDM